MAMLLQDRTISYQASLANYCRTGIYNSIPGVVEKNVDHYRRLVFNIVKGSLESAYPLTYELLQGAEWDDLVTRFFANHSCQSPQVWQMPLEFYEYVNSSEPQLAESYPFVISLLWFEWLEIEVFMMEDIKTDYRQSGDIGIDKLILNPESRIERFSYPVHTKKASDIGKGDYGDYFVSLHRDPESGSVRFTDLSPAYAQLLKILGEQPQTYNSLIENLSKDLGFEASDETVNIIKIFILRSIENRLIIGFRK